MVGGFAVPEPGGAPPEELSEDAIVERVMCESTCVFESQ